MQALIIAPNKVQIGIQNLKLDVFDDGKQLQKAGGFKKIQAIRVFYTEKSVRGFEIFYKLNAGDLLKAGHNVPKTKKDLKNVLIEIGPDDYVSEIFGAYQSAKKNRIINITFITYRGKVQTFGGKGDQSFGFCFPGSTFGAFKGGYNKSVEWLEIDVLPLPDDFKNEMTKLGILRIQQLNGQPERTQSNVNNPSNTPVQGPIIIIPKIHLYSFSFEFVFKKTFLICQSLLVYVKFVLKINKEYSNMAVQVAKPMIGVSAITVPQVNQQNINLQQQQPQQNVPFQQQQYQQCPQQYTQQQYPQYTQQQQYPQYTQQQQIPNQQNPYVPYNQQPQSQNPYNNVGYPKFN